MRYSKNGKKADYEHDKKALKSTCKQYSLSHLLSKSKDFKKEKTSTWDEQKDVLKSPYVWILGLASAFMYISRYAVNSWGPYYFEAAKGYTLTEANSLVAISAVCGILGTASSGFISDKFFKGRRNAPALIFGLMNSFT